MGKALRQMIGGALKPGDPRRFLIEAMVGAMTADGSVDDRELEVLERQLEEHDLFAGLRPGAGKMLIELGTDAIRFAGGGARRIPTMAKALASRTHRLAAFAMACEVCAADEDIADSEQKYLEALRVAFIVSEREANDIYDAARRRRAMSLLEDKLEKLRSLVPMIVDCFALKVLSEGAVEDSDKNRIRDVLMTIPDIPVPPDVVSEEIERAFRHSQRRRQNLDSEIGLLALDLNDQTDRFWTMVYLLVAELGHGNQNGVAVPFILHLQDVFELSSTDMRQAQACAKLFTS